MSKEIRQNNTFFYIFFLSKTIVKYIAKPSKASTKHIFNAYMVPAFYFQRIHGTHLFVYTRIDILYFFNAYMVPTFYFQRVHGTHLYP